MSSEIYWLTLTALLTGVLWIPYIINRLREMGPIPAVMNPNADPTPDAPWAARMMKAHTNAVENLVVFAPLALAVHVTGQGTEATALACLVFFWSRVVHAIVYTLGVPLARTLAFFVGFVCQMLLVYALLHGAAA